MFFMDEEMQEYVDRVSVIIARIQLVFLFAFLNWFI